MLIETKLALLAACSLGNREKERVLIKYFLTVELSVAVTIELQWENEVMPKEKQNAAPFSYITLKSDPLECSFGLLEAILLLAWKV